MLAIVIAALLPMLLVSSLTIRVTNERLAWRFGIGVIRKNVAIADIASVAIATTRWWEGWGIRRTSRGWLYNVSGFDVLAVTQTSGKRLLLGTDDARRLKSAIERAMADCAARASGAKR